MSASESQLARCMRRCVHFTGTRNIECKVGVRYLNVRDTACRPYGLPCLDTGLPCDSRRLPTLAKAKAEEAEAKASLESFFGKLERGECAMCGANVEPRKQVGRCIYAACGHRIGQGTI